MAQQTAVDYLISELRSSVLHKNEIRLIRPYINHAKQMEKEQMLWFFRKFHMINEESNSHYIKEFEQYYNETYGNEGV